MLTNDKAKSIVILIHTILSDIYEINNDNNYTENEFFKLNNDNKVVMNNEIKELIVSLESEKLTSAMLDITLGNIHINRLLYYYSIGLKCIERFKKNNEIYSETLLSIMLLSNLIEDRNIFKLDTKTTKLLALYEKDVLKYSNIVSMIELSNLLISEISKANYARMITKKSKLKRRR